MAAETVILTFVRNVEDSNIDAVEIEGQVFHRNVPVEVKAKDVEKFTNAFPEGEWKQSKATEQRVQVARAAAEPVAGAVETKHANEKLA